MVLPFDSVRGSIVVKSAVVGDLAVSTARVDTVDSVTGLVHSPPRVSLVYGVNKSPL